MKWILNLSTRAKLFLGFGLVIVLFGVAIGAAFLGITAIRDSETRLFEVDHANAVELARLESNLHRARADTLTMMGTTNRAGQEALALDINTYSRQSDESTQRLLERNRDDRDFVRKLEELKAIRESFKQTRDQKAIPLIREGKIEEVKALQAMQGERFEKFRAIAAELGAGAESSARNSVIESVRKANQAITTFVAVGVVALLLSLMTSIFLNHLISRPLQQITVVADRMAAGDLTVNISADPRADEVGLLAQAFARLNGNLRSQIRGIVEGANVLGSSTSEISTSTTQLAASASETATAVSETTTTVEEVRQTAQVSSQKARTVADSAQKVALSSQSGRKSTEDVAAGMDRIRQQMEAIAASMMRLSEQSQTIGQIIATVEDLSAQSNLLAVNAAMEAAKAGEQGKGFGVVAQEVKSLAEQSRQATNQVRTILGDIQKATAAAVMATEQGSKAVETGTRQAEVAGEAIQALTGSVTEAAQAATQIAASSQQQLVGVDQVAGAMESIKQASTQNVAGAKQLETAARNLNDLGQRLKQMVERYQV